MDMLKILDLVSVDEDRTETDKALAQQAVDEARGAAIGATVIIGKTLEEAQAAGEAAAIRMGNNYRVWYELDPDVVYPETIKWMRNNGQLLATLAGTSTGELITQALNGVELASFTLKCQQFAPANLVPIVDVWERAWDLALTPRDEVDDPTDLLIREKALEAARLFVTEALHQATGQPIGIHWAKSDPWKL